MTAPNPTPYAKDLGNLLYHSAIVGGLSVGYSMIGKRVLKMKPADLGRLDVEDSAKIVGTVALSLYGHGMCLLGKVLFQPTSSRPPSC